MYVVRDLDFIPLNLTCYQILYPVLFLGVIGCGGRFTGSNPSYTATELGHHLKLSQARFVLTTKAQLGTVSKAASLNDIAPSRIIIVDGDEVTERANHTTLATLLQIGQTRWRTHKHDDASSKITAALMSTSGTTGLPKMAARSHHSWIAENEAIEDRSTKPYEVRPKLSFLHIFAAC